MTDWYEPGYKAGGPIQSCRNIVNLFKDEFNFHILTSDRDLGDTASYPAIQPNQWQTVDGCARIFYASPGYLDKKGFVSIIEQVKPDVVYFNSMFSPAFTIKPFWLLRNVKFKGKIVLAPRGMLHAGALQKKTLKKKIFLAAFKAMGWHKQVLFHATDEQEKKDIQAFFSGRSNVVLAENIPNVDPAPWSQKTKQPSLLNCIFISRIHPKKNLDFIFNAIEHLSPGCSLSLDIFGEEDDPVYSQHCRKQAESASSNCKIAFHGPLPHTEVFTTLKKYHLFVLPTLGENFGHSIYEALSAGVPVLISDKTPWRNLHEVMAGMDVPLQDARVFASALESFCNMDQEEYDKWSASARKYAQQFTRNIDFFSRYAPLFA